MMTFCQSEKYSAPSSPNSCTGRVRRPVAERAGGLGLLHPLRALPRTAALMATPTGQAMGQGDLAGTVFGIAGDEAGRAAALFEARQGLAEATKQREVVERLRDRFLAAERRQADHLDTLSMAEIASTQHAVRAARERG